MSEKDGGRIWANRIIGFLVGGLLALAAMGWGVVGPLKSQNATLAEQLDTVENGAARLLGEAKVLAENRSYDSALRTLDDLFQRQPGSNEVADGRKLYAEIETAVRERDQKWETASVAVRDAWEKATAAALRAKSEEDRQAMEKSMSETLAREWERSKDRVRQEWENGES